MELRDYLRVLRRSWLLILIITVVGIGTATAYSLVKTPDYSATTKVFVSTQSATSVTDLTQGNTFTQQVVQSYTDIVTTPIVLTRVIRELDLDSNEQELAKQVTASAALNTVVIQITATDESPQTAARIADSVASSLTKVVSRLAPTTANGAVPVKVTVVQEANIPTSPASPNIPLNVALGLLIGLILGIGIAVLRSILDTRIHSLHDITATTDAPILGGITFDSSAASRPLIVQDDPRSPRAESFRSLRTNLQFLDYEGRAHSFVFTSAIEGEGKTTTVANLAIALTDNGTRVVVVDADLRQPRLAPVLGLEGAVGLSDVLIGRVSLDDALQDWGAGGMRVLPAGQMPPNPSELLGSQSMTDIINTLTEWFDVVLIDAPPLLPVTDAAILSKRTGGAIVIAAAGKTHRGQLKSAIEVLTGIGSEVLGIVVTMLPTKGQDAYSYGKYGYGYGYGPDAERAKSDADRKIPFRAREKQPAGEKTSSETSSASSGASSETAADPAAETQSAK